MSSQRYRVIVLWGKAFYEKEDTWVDINSQYDVFLLYERFFIGSFCYRRSEHGCVRCKRKEACQID